MRSGIWADVGDEAARVVVEDELTLRARAREILPGLPHVLYGHSWGSIIARAVATAPRDELSGLVLGGIAAQWRGIEQSIDRTALAELSRGERAGSAPRSSSTSSSTASSSAAARAPAPRPGSRSTRTSSPITDATPSTTSAPR